MPEVNLREKLKEILGGNKDTGKSQYAIQPLSDVEKRKEEKTPSISKPFIYGTALSYPLTQNIFTALGLGGLAAFLYYGYKKGKKELEERRKLNSELTPIADQLDLMYGIPRFSALFAGTVWYRKWQAEREAYMKNPTKAMVEIKSDVDSCIKSYTDFLLKATAPKQG